MALNAQQVADARNWVNQQYGMTLQPDGNYAKTPWNFDSGDFANQFKANPDSNMGWDLLGAGQAMGYGDADIAQILGFNPSEVTAYHNAQPQSIVNNEALTFQHDNPQLYGNAGGPTIPNGGAPATMTGQLPTSLPYTLPYGGASSLSALNGGVGPGPTQGAPAGMDYGPIGGMNPNGGSNPWGNLGGMNLSPMMSNPFGSYTPSPYLDQIASGLRSQSNRNLTEGILPSIRQAAVAAGGVGGSRQGIAEGQAIGQSQSSLDGTLASLYGGDFTNAMNRNLQKYGMDQGYSLGQGQLGLGFLNSDRNYDLGKQGLGLQNQGQMLNFYQGQRGQDLAQYGLGAQLTAMGIDGPWNGLNSAGNILNGVGANNYNVTGGTSGGGGVGGAVGGALTGWSLYNALNRPIY